MPANFKKATLVFKNRCSLVAQNHGVVIFEAGEEEVQNLVLRPNGMDFEQGNLSFKDILHADLEIKFNAKHFKS